MHDLKDVITMLERHDRALFGNPDDLKNQPGALSELTRVGRLLEDINTTMHRLAWIIVTANLAGMLALILKK
jgi:hypothetical protein